MAFRYAARRQRIEAEFDPAGHDPSSEKVHESPSGKYRLTTGTWHTRSGGWDYSRGLITRVPDGELLCDVKRNYGLFWHAWVSHPNGFEYLLCGEDYQGYSVLNLETSRYLAYFPEEGYEGTGLCWAAVHPSPGGLVLAVEACVWACPWQLVLYDFSQPEQLPLPVIAIHDGLWECHGWVDGQNVRVTLETEIRLSDGVPVSSLSAEEQAELSGGPDLTAYRRDTVLLPVPPGA